MPWLCVFWWWFYRYHLDRLGHNLLVSAKGGRRPHGVSTSTHAAPPYNRVVNSPEATREAAAPRLMMVFMAVRPLSVCECVCTAGGAGSMNIWGDGGT
jgi:hypothetical protein